MVDLRGLRAIHLGPETTEKKIALYLYMQGIENRLAVWIETADNKHLAVYTLLIDHWRTLTGNV